MQHQVIPEPAIGDKWGRWTLKKLKPQTWQCSCGTERIIAVERPNFYRNGYLSLMCRKCRQTEERNRLTRMFNCKTK